MDVFIYALFCPKSGELRYIGKTTKVSRRLIQHVYGGSKSKKNSWIQGLKKEGLRPEIDIIETIKNSDDTDWQISERFWISFFRFIGCRITNTDEGGRGGANRPIEVREKLRIASTGRRWSQETVEKMRKIRTGFKHTKETCEKMTKTRTGKKIKPWSEESKKRMSEATKGKKKKPRTAEHIANLKLALKGKGLGKKRGPRTQECKDKISAAKKGKPGKPLTEEQKTKISLWHKGRKHSPEHVKKRAESKRKTHELRRLALSEAEKQNPAQIK